MNLIVAVLIALLVVALLAVLAVALLSPVDALGSALFAGHMIQHVLLGMVVPVLVVLAAPLTLALQSASPATRRSLRSPGRAGPGRSPW